MSRALLRAERLIPGLWLGWLLCVALLATPAAFALLERADAGRLAGRMLAQEAYTSLALAVAMLLLDRRSARHAHAPASPMSITLLLSLGAAFCTVAGYFALQPMMAAARAGQGALSFGQLHAISAAFYAAKVGLVAALAWRASARP